MAALDFPTNPNDGDVYQGYVFDSATEAWNRLASNIPGPTGPFGPTGPTGPVGPEGLDGNVVQNLSTDITSSYTLSESDIGNLLIFNSASEISLFVPNDSEATISNTSGFYILQKGAGQVAITGNSGVTVQSTPGNKTRDQWSLATLIKIGINEWVLVGDTSP